jgi:tRNA(adenine34) deaminase
MENPIREMGKTNHQQFMELAFEQAEVAANHQEVPVGAVVVEEGKVIGRGHNTTIGSADPRAHAEVNAISQALSHGHGPYFYNCSIYITLEPCAMCAGALMLCRVGTVVFGAYDPKSGACGSLYNLLTDPRLNHEARVVGGVLADRSSDLLRNFFESKRRS